MPLEQVDALPSAAGTSAAGEQTVFTTIGIAVGQGIPAGVIIWGWVSVTLGTGATGIQVRCRENTTGLGNQIDQTINETGLTAGNTYVFPFLFSDKSPSFDNSGNAQYNLTVQQTGAPSAVPTMNGGDLVVEV